MAAEMNNDLTHGLRGRVGEYFVFRKVRGMTIAHRAPRKPDPKKQSDLHVRRSKKQLRGLYISYWIRNESNTTDNVLMFSGNTRPGARNRFDAEAEKSDRQQRNASVPLTFQINPLPVAPSPELPSSTSRISKSSPLPYRIRSFRW